MLIRPFLREDTKDSYSFYSNPRLFDYIGDGTPWANEVTRETHLDRHIQYYQKNGYGFLAVILKAESKSIGHVALKPLEERDVFEVGWLIHPDYQGRGYATEASRAILSFALNEWKLDRVVAVAQEKNQASCKVMEKIGLNFYGKEICYGSPCVLYEILQSEPR